jgi:hypothetical protein
MLHDVKSRDLLHDPGRGRVEDVGAEGVEAVQECRVPAGPSAVGLTAVEPLERAGHAVAQPGDAIAELLSRYCLLVLALLTLGVVGVGPAGRVVLVVLSSGMVLLGSTVFFGFGFRGCAVRCGFLAA